MTAYKYLLQEILNAYVITLFGVILNLNSIIGTIEKDVKWFKVTNENATNTRMIAALIQGVFSVDL